ncbi:MAG: hypothetical protein FRX48_03585 [Lasallia pustulata]|uniref:Uncharacterized protein n=1 Tax=Lasallia pustulata TaxID=136370 RepID=A0A5M8PT37_9LECA|nr:MAG: hypothetical protein FRX48_03585 [Lasallia pustulata]
MLRSILGVGLVYGLVAAVNAQNSTTTGSSSNGTITSTAQIAGIDSLSAIDNGPAILLPGNGLTTPSPTTTPDTKTTTTAAIAGPTSAPQTASPTTTASPAPKPSTSSSSTSIVLPVIVLQQAAASKDVNNQPVNNQPVNNQPASNPSSNNPPTSTANGESQPTYSATTFTFHLQQSAISTPVDPPASNPALTLSNTPLSVAASSLLISSASIALPALASTNLIIGPSSSTLALVELPPSPTTTLPPSIGSLPLRPLSNGFLLLSSSTLPPGAQTTVDNTVLSVGPSFLVIGASTYPLPPAPTSTSTGPQFHIAANGGVVLPNGNTLDPGGPATTLAGGTVMSLFPDGGGLVVNGSTIALAMPTPTGPAVLTVAGEALTVGTGDLVFEGSTVGVGGWRRWGGKG